MGYGVRTRYFSLTALCLSAGAGIFFGGAISYPVVMVLFDGGNWLGLVPAMIFASVFSVFVAAAGAIPVGLAAAVPVFLLARIYDDRPIPGILASGAWGAFVGVSVVAVFQVAKAWDAPEIWPREMLEAVVAVPGGIAAGIMYRALLRYRLRETQV